MEKGKKLLCFLLIIGLVWSASLICAEGAKKAKVKMGALVPLTGALSEFGKAFRNEISPGNFKALSECPGFEADAVVTMNIFDIKACGFHFFFVQTNRFIMADTLTIKTKSVTTHATIVVIVFLLVSAITSVRAKVRITTLQAYH